MTAKELIKQLEKLVATHGDHELVDCDNAPIIFDFKYDLDETSEPNEAFVWRNGW